MPFTESTAGVRPDSAVTFFPHKGVWVSGSHTDYNEKVAEKAIAHTSFSPAMAADGTSPLTASLKTDTTVIDQGMRTAMDYMREHKDAVLGDLLGAHRGSSLYDTLKASLSAADFPIGRENIDNLVLVQLLTQLMSRQDENFHLHKLTSEVQAPRLQLRLAYADSPAAGDFVGERERYTETERKYDNVELDLRKFVTSWNISVEQKQRALIDPIAPLVDSNRYANLAAREREAASALANIGLYYTKSGATTSAKFTTTEPDNNDTDRIGNPSTIASGATHSTNDPITEINDARTEFWETHEVFLDYFACHPATATQLARNTWTRNNTIFNVEAYRVAGGSRPFPGIDDTTLVISPAVPQNTVYGISKANRAILRAEGPKITQTWENHETFTTNSASLDFFQIKCIHEDLDDIDRRFAVIFPLSSA